MVSVHYLRCTCFGAVLILLSHGLLAWPQAAPAPEDEIIVEGDPPLLQSDVDAWRRLLELAFGGTLTRDQAAALQESLIAQWREGNRALRDQLAQAKAAWAQLDAAQGVRREVMRLGLRAELLEAAERDREDPVSKLVFALYDVTSPVLVEGDPPLRRGSVVALIDLLQWLASRAGNGAARLPDLERERFITHLVQRYPHASPGDRMLLAHLEDTFAWLQAEWEAAGPEAQAHFRTNLARTLGVQGPLPSAPYAGPTESWRHPDGLFTVDYPSEWSVRYASLSDGPQIAGWTLLDVTLLGDAEAPALEIAALPEAGALISVAMLPTGVRDEELGLDEASVALAHDLLTPFGPCEPLSHPIVGPGAVLTAWGQQCAGVEYVAWVSVVVCPEPPGAAIVTLARAPAARKADLEPALNKVLYSLRVADSSAPPISDLLNAPTTRDILLDLLNTPLSAQMDLIEGLTSGVGGSPIAPLRQSQ